MALKTSRLFYALWPDTETANRLARLQGDVQGRRTPVRDLHMTLVFLGNRAPDWLDVFREVLMNLPLPDLTLTIDRLGYFRGHRIAWAGMTSAPAALFQLQEGLSQDLAGRSVPGLEQAGYRPHITLARHADEPKEHVLWPIVWRADRIVLARSAAQPDRGDGARYQIVASRP